MNLPELAFTEETTVSVTGGSQGYQDRPESGFQLSNLDLTKLLL